MTGTGHLCFECDGELVCPECDGLAARVSTLETALREACHIAGRLDSLLAGFEDEETLEECRQAANVWMERIRNIDDALAEGDKPPSASAVPTELHT